MTLALRVIQALASSDHPMTVKQLSAQLETDKNYTTVIVKTLLNEGNIQSVGTVPPPSGKGKHARMLAATEKGNALLKHTLAAMQSTAQ